MWAYATLTSIVEGDVVSAEHREYEHEAAVATRGTFSNTVVPLFSFLMGVQVTDTAATEVELCHDTPVDVEEMSADKLADPNAEGIFPEPPPSIEGKKKFNS